LFFKKPPNEDEYMITAVTVWQGRVSPVLDAAQFLVVAEIEAGSVRSQREETFLGNMPHEKVARLCTLGVNVLVCGAVSRPLAELISSSGIRLIPFVSGELGEVLEAMAAGHLPDRAFSMPGCGCRQGRRFRGRRHVCSSHRAGAKRGI